MIYKVKVDRLDAKQWVVEANNQLEAMKKVWISEGVPENGDTYIGPINSLDSFKIELVSEGIIK
jgi:hypothetical protein